MEWELVAEADFGEAMRILTKVIALPGRQVFMRFRTHQHYTLILKKRQNTVRMLLYIGFPNGWAKLSRRRARYHHAMALFPSPLSERSVTVSVSLRSPVVQL